jgi:hypothetical protein
VVASAFFHTRVVWAEHHTGDQVHVMEATASENRRVTVVPSCPFPDVHFGFSIPPSQTWGVMSAAAPGRQRIVVAPKLDAVMFDVLGTVGVCLRNGEPSVLTAAVIASTGESHLAWRSRGVGREVLPTSGTRLAAVAVCPAQPNVAWVTEPGEVVVYSMQHDAVLFRRPPGEAT